MEIKKRKTRMYEPWGYQDQNNYQSSEIINENELNEFFSDAKYDKENNKIDFYNKDGESVAQLSVSELVSNKFDNAEYDSSDKKIKFYGEGKVVSTIDATPFLEGGGFIEDIYLDKDTNELVIVWDSESGTEETRIPLTDIFNPDDYYDKDEINDLLEKKLDVSAYTDISEQVEENTANIEAISGGINTLIEKLGYTDNDTLVRNGEHEVAFGQYNISNTSDEPSGRTIFSVGIGTDDSNRSNAIEIRENGDVYMWVEGDFMNVNKLLGQIAHEVYDGDSTHNSSHFFDGD